jgi:hypothetical protein
MPPPARPVESDYEPTGFYFAPELLALQFDNADTEYGTDMTSGNTSSVDNGYELGGRLGLGYRWRNRWDFVVRGTLVNSSNSDSQAAAGGAGIDTTFGAGFDTAMAKLDVDYTTIDAEVGHTWGAWERSHLRLFFGPRAAWINQELRAQYDPSTGVAGDLVDTDEEQDMNAIGLRVGVEGDIAFGPHWAFILQGAIAALDANFDNDYMQTSSSGTVVDADTHTGDDDTVTEFDAQAAFRWQKRAFEDGSFGIRFGWQFEHWNDVPSLTDVGAASPPHVVDNDFENDGPFVRLEWIF